MLFKKAPRKRSEIYENLRTLSITLTKRNIYDIHKSPCCNKDFEYIIHKYKEWKYIHKSYLNHHYWVINRFK